MTTLILAVGYLALHLASYFLYFRRLSCVRTELGIFAFHMVSFLMVGLVVLLVSLSQGVWQALTVLLGVCAAHGLYSLSFLELWSLAQGSYSFAVLKMIEHRRVASRDEAVASLSAVGDQKKLERLHALKRLGLAQQDGEVLRLTARGRTAAASFRALRWIANLQETG